MSSIIGIDLGTSTTEAAIYRNGRPELILNFLYEAVTPSAVGINDDGNWVVGARAQAQFLLSPENTAIEVKRAIGSNRVFLIGRRGYSAVDLSAKILEYVRTYAQEYLGEEINRAVISVPAYFDDIQRQQTLTAGISAGFQVERIINEPTAAALSYGLGHMEEESHILVYDLGGGTFDVTLLEMFEGVLEVKASSGDNQLGGKDFDERLISHFCGQFQKETGLDPQNDRSAMARLKFEAESCKKALSESGSYRAVLPNLMKKEASPAGLDLTVTREEFESMTQDLLLRTHSPIDTVLSDSGLTPSDIDHVILVGGSTRMPMVKKDIEAYLNTPVSTSVNPDFAVAEGAAIQAAIISGEISPDDGLIMTDVNPYTLGIRAFDGISYDSMSVIISRNVTIPVTRDRLFYTHHDYQTQADIEVYQGESDFVSENHFLGKFTISGIPAKKANKESIRVQFSYDLNGMLNVTATIVSTGNQGSIEIDMTDTAAGNPDDKMPVIDPETWKEAPDAPKYRAVIRRAEKLLKKNASGSDSEVFEPLKAILEKMKYAVISGDKDLEKAAEEALVSAIRLYEDYL